MSSTSLSVTECRAVMLLEAAIARPDLVERIEDLATLPALAGWKPSIRDHAIDVLIARGNLTEAADGRLTVRPWADAPDSTPRAELVLRRLRLAGAQGVGYADIRVAFRIDPEIVLDEVRALGNTVQRTPSDHGVLAVLIDEASP